MIDASKFMQHTARLNSLSNAAHEFIFWWASDSHSGPALALQNIAAKIHGKEFIAKERINDEQISSVVDTVESDLIKWKKSTAASWESKYVYRGIGPNNSKELRSALKKYGKLHIQFKNLESWTEDPLVAMWYARSGGLVLRRKAKPHDVWFRPYDAKYKHDGHEIAKEVVLGHKVPEVFEPKDIQKVNIFSLGRYHTDAKLLLAESHYPIIEGLSHSGIAKVLRKALTRFGSGWQGLDSRLERHIMKLGEGSAIVNAGTACIPSTLRRSSRIIRSTV